MKRVRELRTEEPLVIKTLRKIFFILGGILLGLTLDVGAATQPQKKLNVLMIIADDWNVDMGCYGYPVKTPHVDRLASMGVKFDRAYCQYPLCNPSRTSFLSGLRPETTHVFFIPTDPADVLKNPTYISDHFQKNGYFTARYGKVMHGYFADELKWDINGAHNEDLKKARESLARKYGPKAATRTNETTNVTLTTDEDGQPVTYHHTGSVQSPLDPKPEDPIYDWEAVDQPDEALPDGKTRKLAIELLEKQKDSTKPFFIAVGFQKPHTTYVAPKKYFDLYDVNQIALPQYPANDLDDIPPLALHDMQLHMSDVSKREVIRAYYACCSFIDAQMGMIFDAMDRLKLWDNTVVLFLGDHGYHLGEHNGLWNKVTLFEEAARVPLIVYAPGMKQGVPSPRLVEFVDLYPTLTELCGIPNPQGLEGTSFVPLLKNPDRPWKKAAFTDLVRGPHRELGLNHSLRTERYRYTEWADGRFELYDKVNDPNEYTNLAEQPGSASVLKEMKALMKAGWKGALPPSNDN